MNLVVGVELFRFTPVVCTQSSNTGLQETIHTPTRRSDPDEQLGVPGYKPPRVALIKAISPAFTIQSTLSSTCRFGRSLPNSH